MKNQKFIAAESKTISVQISTPTVGGIEVKPTIILVIEEEGEPDMVVYLSAIAAVELSEQLQKQTRKLALLLSANQK